MSDEQLLDLLNMTDEEVLSSGWLDDQTDALRDPNNPDDEAMLGQVLSRAANMYALGPLRQLALMIANERIHDTNAGLLLVAKDV